ncbi:DUF3465 domain-containing protein [Snodgrassella sp. CFCC 13594]|uniref:DUF3465 domain-containing protein n=1 Tax=Snodgrassella sp. CFCC 13594 TaxID=1775559 RepID=UPI0009EE7FF7|nr:DUF3465 domain-containing protein [Snodgrassella sp. CFCC 13594]
MSWKNGLVLLLVAAAVWWWQGSEQDGTKSQAQQQVTQALRAAKESLLPTSATTTSPSGNNEVAEAYAQQRSDVPVRGEGEVVKVLKDDNEGDRHQRFILRLADGQTILVAHNIDLAPKLTGLQAGDQVSFQGEYVYNPQGGVLHWTHHDPQGRHDGGWLQYQGRTYQ